MHRQEPRPASPFQEALGLGCIDQAWFPEPSQADGPLGATLRREERAWAPLPGRAPPRGQPTDQAASPDCHVLLRDQRPGTGTHVAHGGQLLTQGPTFQRRGGSLLGVDSIVINSELSAHEVGSAGQAPSVQGHPPSAQGSKQLTVCPVRSLQSIRG